MAKEKVKPSHCVRASMLAIEKVMGAQFEEQTREHLSRMFLGICRTFYVDPLGRLRHKGTDKMVAHNEAQKKKEPADANA